MPKSGQRVQVLHIEVSCEDVWREISNYIEGDISPDLRAAMELHLQGCRPCTAVLDGAQNLIRLIGCDATFRMPTDFSQRLHRRIQCEIEAEEQRVEEQYASRRVPLGITDEDVNLGSHLLYFWENDEEFERGVRFLEPGLRARDVCVIQGHDEAIERSLNVLRSHGFDTRELITRQRLFLVRREHAAQRTLLDFEAFLRASVNSGAPAIRILGNLGMGRDPLPAGEDDVVELEKRATGMISRFPCVLICMYELKTLPGRLVMKGGLENHQHTICTEGLRENPHYRPDAEVLNQPVRTH
jgi:MEDS: MEthanogen/methylotroph, DcmR Sensory domain/Putative zinc-finger